MHSVATTIGKCARLRAGPFRVGELAEEVGSRVLRTPIGTESRTSNEKLLRRSA